MIAVLAWVYLSLVLAVPATLIALATKPGVALRQAVRKPPPTPGLGIAPSNQPTGRASTMPAPSPQRLSSPTKRRQATAARGGGAGVGLLALIGGILLHDHYEPIKAICDSGLGALGQALEPSAHSHCSLDSALAEVGTVATVIGGVILAGVLLTAIGLLLEARAEAGKPATAERKTAAVSPKPATPTRQTGVTAPPLPNDYKLVSTSDPLAVTVQQPGTDNDGKGTVQGVDAGVSAKRT